MNEKTKQRIEEIRKRLEDYHKCPNGPHGFYYYYNCYRSDIIKDVEFLLNELKRLRVLTTLRHSPSRISEK